jgi:protein SCO1/2
LSLLGVLSGSPLARADDDSKDAEPHACANHQPLPGAAPVPGKSLYNLSAQLTDQNGKPLLLSAFRGQTVLVAMFYSSCTSICPMLIAKLQRIEALLPATERSRTAILLVSLDPARDTPAALLALEKQHGVDGKQWHFTRTDASTVRKLAALLGVRYRMMPDGTIAHSAIIAVLDHDGVLETRIEGTTGDPAVVMDAVRRANSKPPVTQAR